MKEIKEIILEFVCVFIAAVLVTTGLSAYHIYETSAVIASILMISLVISCLATVSSMRFYFPMSVLIAAFIVIFVNNVYAVSNISIIDVWPAELQYSEMFVMGLDALLYGFVIMILAGFFKYFVANLLKLMAR